MSNPLNYLGSVKAPTRAIAREVNDHLNKVGKPLPVYPEMGSSVMWGYNSGGAEHGTGRAIDFMTRNSKSVGDEVAAYLWENRERFGLIHLIWRQRIRSTVTSPGAWRGMADRGSPTENHRDHVHAYFNGKAVPGSSGGSQSTAPAPKPTYYKPTGTTLSVKEIQGIVGAKADGAYGDNTKAAVAVYQRKLGVTADGYWGKLTQAAHDKKGPSAPAPKPAPKPSTALLKKGSKGAAVKRLQQGLNKNFPAYSKLAVDSIFGSATERAVKEFQRRSKLTADGVVGAKTRAALAKHGIKA